MADSFHFAVNIISRGKGKSAVASAAYISGEKIKNEWDGVTHDYTRKSGIIHKEILLPKHVPKEYYDRTTLWNSVEMIEKNSNAQLARNFIIALPKELNFEENTKLIEEFVREHFVSRGMIVDFALHNETKEGNQNIHAHIMTIVRPINLDGTWGQKSKKEYLFDGNGEPILTKSGQQKTRKIELTDWNDKGNVEKWREGFSKLCNEYLERNGKEKRVDHRSFKRQGLDQIPTIHLGAAASALENKGIKTEKGDINREIKKQNALMKTIKAEVLKLKSWLSSFSNQIQEKYDQYKQAKKEEYENKSELFNLYEYLSFYQDMQEVKRQGLNNYAKQNKTRYDLKKFSSGVNYLSDNKLKTIAGLHTKIESLKAENRQAFKKIKDKSERIENLNKCFAYANIIKETQTIYNEWENKKIFKESFYKNNQASIEKYQRARNMIEKISGSKSIKQNDWQEEIKSLEKEIQQLNQISGSIKEEYKNINHIKYAVEIVNAEYGIDLSIEIDKAIRRGDKPSIIKQLENYKKQADIHNKHREIKKEVNKKSELIAKMRE